MNIVSNNKLLEIPIIVFDLSNVTETLTEVRERPWLI